MAILPIEDALLREPNLWVPGKKPVGPVKIDYGHPIADGLIFCALIGTPESSIRDLVSGLVYDEIFSGNNTREATSKGLGVTGTSSGGYLYPTEMLQTSAQDYTLNLQTSFPDQSGTWVTYFRADGAFSMHHALLDPNNILGVYRSGFFGCGFDTDTLSKGVYSVVAAADNSADTTDFYIGGKNVGQSAASANATDAGIEFILNGMTGQGVLQPALSVQVWGRKLSESEAISISLDPYQILMPA